MTVPKNKEIVSRNKIVARIAMQYRIPIVRLYEFMVANKEQYVHTDSVHFDSIANPVIAKAILSKIRGDMDGASSGMDLRHCLRTPLQFEQLIEHSSSKGILIYGAGHYGRIVGRYVQERNGIVAGYVCTDKVKGTVDGLTVNCFDAIKIKMKESVLIVAIADSTNVEQMLLENKISYYKPIDKLIGFMELYVDAFSKK